MSDVFDKLTSKLDVVEEEQRGLAIAADVTRGDIDDDYEFSRKTLRALVKVGMDNLDGLSELCRQTEAPRAYEVLSRTVKDIGDVSDKLMQLQKAKKEVEKEAGEKSAKGTTNNNVFIGSVTDLQKMLQKTDAIDGESHLIKSPEEINE